MKQHGLIIFMRSSKVTPRAGVWIETTEPTAKTRAREVTPRAGVWIETLAFVVPFPTRQPSLPVRECGLKPKFDVLFVPAPPVTPRAGVWIETYVGAACSIGNKVTPRAGVWIETGEPPPNCRKILVTPRAGVWIETAQVGKTELILNSHSPCGSVD